MAGLLLWSRSLVLSAEGDITFEFLATIVLLNVLATIALWRVAARKQTKPKKKFLATLHDSKPITPKHQPPKMVGDKFSSLVTEGDRLFFTAFADFAAVVNWWFADEHVGGPWRLQELPDTVLKLDSSDSPTFGRRYAIFHNQVQLGTLEISPNSLFSVEKPDVVAMIELNWVRLLSCGVVDGLLMGVALHVSDPNPNTKEYFDTRQRIDGALMQVVWQVQQISQYDIDGEVDWGQLELRLEGAASMYFARRQGLRNRQAAA